MSDSQSSESSPSSSLESESSADEADEADGAVAEEAEVVSEGVSVDAAAESEAVAVDAALELESDTPLSEPEPVRLGSAPASCMRAIASFSVSHVTDVPGAFTRGSATHMVPPEQGVTSHAPLTH